jgi:hypothetical protein
MCEITVFKRLFAYSNGSGSVSLQNQQAEAQTETNGLRWIANGKTIRIIKEKRKKIRTLFYKWSSV